MAGPPWRARSAMSMLPSLDRTATTTTSHARHHRRGAGWCRAPRQGMKADVAVPFAARTMPGADGQQPGVLSLAEPAFGCSETAVEAGDAPSATARTAAESATGVALRLVGRGKGVEVGELRQVTGQHLGRGVAASSCRTRAESCCGPARTVLLLQAFASSAAWRARCGGRGTPGREEGRVRATPPAGHPRGLPPPAAAAVAPAASAIAACKASSVGPSTGLAEGDADGAAASSPPQVDAAAHGGGHSAPRPRAGVDRDGV